MTKFECFYCGKTEYAKHGLPKKWKYITTFLNKTYPVCPKHEKEKR